MAEYGPEGWYDDPQHPGMQRRWDGAKWTDDYRPTPAEPVQSAGATSPQPQAEQAVGGNASSTSLRAGWQKVPTWLKWATGVVLVLIIIGAATDSSDSPSDSTDQATEVSTSQAESDSGGSEKSTVDAPTKTPTQVEEPEPEPAEETEPEMTSGQENALASAQQYLDLAGFSRAGLIEQLSSPAGEGYSEADATYAADHVGADWNAEAVEAAKDYLELTPMSKDALIEQLSSPAGEQFTPAQAQYAANKVY